MKKAFLFLLAFCLIVPSAWAARDFRTINTDIYQISLRKNGLADVTLVSREPVFRDACPMIWLDGDKEPKPMDINGRQTERTAIKNGLGQGQGFHYVKGNCEWSLQAYPPAKPYFAAQVAFINNSKKPVKVKMLVPWNIGGIKGGELMLGAGVENAAVLDNGTLTEPEAHLRKFNGNDITSLWDVAVFNPASQWFLVAGFLTNARAYGQVVVGRTDKAKPGMIDQFRGECIYDPPLEVPPGGRLESEVFYVGFDTGNPLKGLEDFAAGVARFNNLKPSRTPLPHGWDSWNTKFKTDITEENMLAALDFIDANLKRYGWTHFSIDAGWEKSKGDWEPNAKFPHGMKWFADEVHKRGMTAGIWIDPFTVDVNSPLAKEHPDWLVKPASRSQVDPAASRSQVQLANEDVASLPENERILDISAPGATDYIKALFHKIGSDWGFDALVEADFVYRLLFAESYYLKNMTRVDAFRLGMKMIREGFGEDKFITGTPPMPFNCTFVDSMRIGDDCAPIWQKAPNKARADARPWGCVDAMANAAHWYYFAPYVWATDPDCAYFGQSAPTFPTSGRTDNVQTLAQRWDVADAPALTWNQSIAWLTAAALTGGVVKIGNYFPDLDPKAVTALSRLLPTLPLPARPVDLFEREQPCIWSLPITSRIGQWHVVAVFNWDAKEAQKTPISFEKIGLSPQEHYTVFDFWQDKYFGIATGQLTVDTAPGSVHLLGLRPYEGRPMFLATDRHFSMGATDFTALNWDDAGRSLTGAFQSVAKTDYTLTVLVPEGYTLTAVSVSTGPVKTHQDGRVLKFSFYCETGGPVNWVAQF